MFLKKIKGLTEVLLTMNTYSRWIHITEETGENDL